jgi:hypothetical protein
MPVHVYVDTMYYNDSQWNAQRYKPHHTKATAPRPAMAQLKTRDVTMRTAHITAHAGARLIGAEKKRKVSGKTIAFTSSAKQNQHIIVKITTIVA